VASYSVIITKTAEKDIADVGDRGDRIRIDQRIRKLAQDPRPAGSKKLEGPGERYRIRQGDYRILYSIDDAIRIVAIIKVGHRKDVYRRRGRA
jgi:mRNA interferase RelE/StbE